MTWCAADKWNEKQRPTIMFDYRKSSSWSENGIRVILYTTSYIWRRGMRKKERYLQSNLVISTLRQLFKVANGVEVGALSSLRLILHRRHAKTSEPTLKLRNYKFKVPPDDCQWPQRSDCKKVAAPSFWYLLMNEICVFEVLTSSIY